MKIRTILKKLVPITITALLITLLMPAAAMAAPLAPTSLAATVQAGPQVALTWTDVANEIGYRVFRALAPSTNFTDITVGIGGLPANSISFPDTTVVAGTTYSYQVVAFDLAGNSPPSNTVTVTVTVPAAPSALTATENAGPPQTVTLSWADNSNNEIGFRIERADNASFTVNKVENVRVANVAVAPVTFVDADVIPGATYFYRVSALAPMGASAASNTATITLTAAAGMAAGPVPPIGGFAVPNGFPLYYQDTLGTKLNLLPLTGINLGDAPIAGNAYSQTLGFGSEAFYYLAAPEITGAGGINGVIEFAFEAIFGSPTGEAVPTVEAVMARTRIRLDVPVDGDYTIQTPYGTRTFAGVVQGGGGANLGGLALDINFTEDIGALPRIFSGPNSPIAPFDPVLNPNPINVFLRPVTPQLGAPAVFGDGVTPTTVTGSPLRNTVIITGPTPAASATYSTWLINGKILAAPVVPSFTRTASSPTSFAFASTSTGSPTSLLWDFGDGTTSTLGDPVHIYAAAGNYVVKLTASNAGGSASASQMVSVFTAPSAAFTTAAGATLFEVSFTSPTQGNPTGWLWNFGDGTTSTLQNPTHTYAASGQVTVTLSVFNPAGTATASQNIIVGPPPAPTNLTAVVASSTQINVSWTDNALNETLFRLERAENNLFTLNLLTRDVPASAGSGLTVTFNDTANITNNVIYFYRVTAFSATSNSVSSAVAQVQVGGPPSGQPVLTATLLSGTQIKLDWTDPNTNEDFYHLHRAPTVAFVPAQIIHTVLPANTITFTDTVTAGQTFFYFIHAMNALGDSPNSTIVQISTTVPAAPAALTATVASLTSVNVNWAAATSASGYIIERSIGAGNVTFTQIGTVGNVLAFTDTTVSAPNTFNYRVFATNVVGPSAASSPTATVDMNPPAAPVLNAAVANADGTINLSWNNVVNEQGYRIQRALGAGAFAQIAQVNADVTAYTDTTAAPQTAYSYMVIVFNGMGTSSSNNVTVTSATPATPPTAPTGLTAAALSSSSVKLDWTDAATNEAGYIVERALVTGNFTVLTAAVPLNSITYTDLTVGASTTYRYQVIAFNIAGNSTAAGPVSVTTPPAPIVSSGGGGVSVGGGGGGGTVGTTVSVSGLSGDTLTVSATGLVQSTARLTTPANDVVLDISSGTVMQTSSGAAPSALSIAAPASVPQSPQGKAVIGARDLGPNGTTFNPAITLSLTYSESDLPAGASENDLVITFWDGTTWVPLQTTVNAEANTLSAPVTHFTVFGILSTVPAPAPAPAPAVVIASPSDGASLTSDNIPVTIEVTNFAVVAPGGANAAGQGHIHYYLDVTIPTTAGQPAISAPGTYKAAPATSVTWENVSLGTHTLGVQLVNNDHTPLDPPVVASISVTVTQAAAPSVSEQTTTPTPAASAPTTAFNWWWIIGLVVVIAIIALVMSLARRRKA